MFGISEDNFALRYDQGREWVEVCEPMLSGAPFGVYDGNYYTFKNA